MNPTDQGKSVLPDNLKMLFRPVSMMEPDFTIIAEVILFSDGFTDSLNLSKKITKMYKLC